MTDLGPDHSTGAMVATATFDFKSAGYYKLCYRLKGQKYLAVGNLMRVKGPAPPTLAGAIEAAKTTATVVSAAVIAIAVST